MSVRLPDGTTVPALGQGTWHMGERGADRKGEAAALGLGITLGMTLIDTAEMYADGGAEEVVGTAVAGRREEVFIVSKVYPHNASRRGVPAACERSLKRMGIATIDLYLLHWRGSVPLAETVEAFERLRDAGKIRHWGVSNFDVDDMDELMDAGGTGCAANQVLYNPEHRGIEFDLLGDHRRRGIPVMAYSPVGQGGRLLRHPSLTGIAQKHGATPAQVAIAWALRHDSVMAIPKAATERHVRENATRIQLDAADLAAIDAAFPPPRRKMGLAML